MSWLGIPYRHRGSIGLALLVLTWLSILVPGQWHPALFAVTAICSFFAMLADLCAAGNGAPPERFQMARMQRAVHLACLISFAASCFRGLASGRDHDVQSLAFFLILVFVTPIYLPPRKAKPA